LVCARAYAARGRSLCCMPLGRAHWPASFPPRTHSSCRCSPPPDATGHTRPRMPLSARPLVQSLLHAPPATDHWPAAAAVPKRHTHIPLHTVVRPPAAAAPAASLVHLATICTLTSFTRLHTATTAAPRGHPVWSPLAQLGPAASHSLGPRSLNWPTRRRPAAVLIVRPARLHLCGPE